MVLLHSTLFWFHIVCGSLALILFWVPIVSRKGGIDHVKYGRHYARCMYSVAFAGLGMSLLVIAFPLTIKHEYANRENAQAIAENLRYFWGFLGLLAILTFVSTRHGLSVLKFKDNRQAMRTVSYLTPVIALTVLGALFIYIGMSRSHPLHTVFGVLSLIVGGNTLRYILKAEVPMRSWILEHIGSLIGSGIGAYTAFLTFGARRMLDLGQWQLLIWIAPGVIGGLASFYVCKMYKVKYKVQSASGVAKEAL